MRRGRDGWAKRTDCRWRGGLSQGGEDIGLEECCHVTKDLINCKIMLSVKGSNDDR